jgi:hypothetical protein
MITLVQGTLASIELLDPGLNLIEVPALRFDKGSNGFSGEKRFGEPRTFSERLETPVGVRIDANR